MGGMLVRRILSFLLLLGIWGQAVSACPDAHVTSAAAHAVVLITTSAPEDSVAAGGEHRCECPAITQNAQAAVSESSKSLLASYGEDAGVLLNSLNQASVTRAVRTRASSYIARRSERPPYLLSPRLLQ